MKGIINLYLGNVSNIVNMSLIAQKGCFVYYNPFLIHKSIPLECFFGEANRIHCANIHKSLAPYIIRNIERLGITKEKLFPNMNTIIHSALNNTLADL